MENDFDSRRYRQRERTPAQATDDLHASFKFWARVLLYGALAFFAVKALTA